MNATPNLNGKTVTWNVGADPRYYRVVWTEAQARPDRTLRVAAVREIDGTLQGDLIDRVRVFTVDVARNGATTARANFPLHKSSDDLLAVVLEALVDVEGSAADVSAADNLADLIDAELDDRAEFAAGHMQGERGDTPSLEDSHPSAGHMLGGYGS
jgi:hypothetical protein